MKGSKKASKQKSKYIVADNTGKVYAWFHTLKEAEDYLSEKFCIIVEPFNGPKDVGE